MKVIPDWMELLALLKSGDPETKEFSDAMLEKKHVDDEFMDKYMVYLFPLGAYWVHVKRIMMANNCIKAQWGPDVVPPCTIPFCGGVMSTLCHLFRCNQKEKCPIPDCYDNYKIIEHMVTCEDKANCVLCYPLVNETLILIELEALINDTREEGYSSIPEKNYYHMHYYSMTFNRHIWKMMTKDLLHVFECGQHAWVKCGNQNCPIFMKHVEHLKNCTETRECENLMCFPLKRAIKHWNFCTLGKHCVVCGEWREAAGNMQMNPYTWKRGDVDHTKYPPLLTHEQLADGMKKLKFTKVEAKLKYPPTGELRSVFKNVTYHFVMVLHANACRHPNFKCSVPQCAMMKGVIEHVKKCPIKQNCPENYCSSTRLILLHWKNCNDTKCSMCEVIKEFKEGKMYRDLKAPMEHISE